MGHKSAAPSSNEWCAVLLPSSLGLFREEIGNGRNQQPQASSDLRVSQQSFSLCFHIGRYQGDFTGVYDPTVVAGTAAFTATFQDGKNASATLTYSGGYLHGVLLQVPSKSGETSIQRGDIQGTLGQCKTVTTTRLQLNELRPRAFAEAVAESVRDYRSGRASA